MTKQEFMKSKPIELPAFYKAHKLRQQMRDEEMWYLGKYVEIAVSVAIDHCLNGKTAKSEYVKKPFLIAEKEEVKKKNKNKEKNEELAVFEMKKRTMILEKYGLQQSPS